MTHYEELMQEVLSGLLCSIDNVYYGLPRLLGEFFESSYLPVFESIKSHFQLTGSVMLKEDFIRLMKLSKVSEDGISRYLNVYDYLAEKNVPEASFKACIDSFIKVVKHTRYSEMLVSSAMQFDKVNIGEEKAITSYLYENLSNIDKIGSLKFDKANLRAKDLVKETYYGKKCGDDLVMGCHTGIPIIDKNTQGGTNGELWLVGAFTGDGKSMFLQNSAYFSAIYQGKNIVIGSAEMPIEQYYRRFLVRHTCHEKFGNPFSISYNAVSQGLLTAEEEDFFFNVVTEDFLTHPDYGRIEIFTIPMEADLNYIDTTLHQYANEFNVDGFYWDYLGILKAPRKRQTRREELNEIITGAKQIAMNFNDGKGLFIMSAFQTKREAWEIAMETGYYTLTAFAETAEAERSSDVALFLLRTKECQEKNEIQAGILKNRDNKAGIDFIMHEKFECSYIGPMADSEG